MKTLEYLKKYNLNNGWNNKVLKEFLKDMIEDLKVTVEYLKPDSFRKFNQVIKQMRDKFDGLSNKIPFGIPDFVWSAFYKEGIIPLRTEWCPEESAKHNAAYQAEGERRKKLIEAKDADKVKPKAPVKKPKKKVKK